MLNRATQGSRGAQGAGGWQLPALPPLSQRPLVTSCPPSIPWPRGDTTPYPKEYGGAGCYQTAGKFPGLRSFCLKKKN